MGKDGTYRWERRRKRREGQKTRREFQAFWGFELLLFFLVFFIGTVGIRMFLLQALNNSYCIEAVASYGGSQMFQSVFQAFFWLTMLGIFFWVAMTVAFHKIIWKSKSGIFHSAQLICLILLLGSFNALHIDDLNVPDGNLPTKYLIVDLSKEEPKYFNRPDSFLSDETIDEYSYWSLGEPDRGYFEYLENACAWADTSLITVNSYRQIDGYGEHEEAEQYQLWKKQRYIVYDYPPRLGLAGFKFFISAFYGPHTAAERMQSIQTYRSMTREEVSRLEVKSACLDEAVLSTDIKDCEFYWVFDGEKFYWDTYYGPDAVAQRRLLSKP